MSGDDDAPSLGQKVLALSAIHRAQFRISEKERGSVCVGGREGGWEGERG